MHWVRDTNHEWERRKVQYQERTYKYCMEPGRVHEIVQISGSSTIHRNHNSITIYKPNTPVNKCIDPKKEQHFALWQQRLQQHTEDIFSRCGVGVKSTRTTSDVKSWNVIWRPNIWRTWKSYGFNPCLQTLN
jgi:hypothetical protein